MAKANFKLDDLDYIQLALREAKKASTKNEVPIGAILLIESLAKDQETITKEQKLIESPLLIRAHNLRETKQDPMGHAELLAIKKAARKLKSWRLSSKKFKSTLYVTLEPCPMCLAACQQARINRVVYAAHDPKGGAISNHYHMHSDTKLNHRFSVDYAEVKAASDILSDFFKQLRKSKKK